MPEGSGDSYTLLDSGDVTKLEQVGPFLLQRPCSQALWKPKLPTSQWKQADAVYERSSSGGGSWRMRNPLPEEWEVDCGRRRMKVKATNFGHLGFFAEQAIFWDWIATHSQAPLKVLNLFAYTGGSTLAAAEGGAEVTHCDSSKGIIQWARENAAISGLQDAPIRWILDDAALFVKKELRREKRYDAIILDPPSFGRGPKGQVWKQERDLPDMLDQCRQLLSEDPAFVLLSNHTPGISPMILHHLLEEALDRRDGHYTFGEMTIPHQETGRMLPSGSFAIWSRSPKMPSPLQPARSY